MWTEKPTLHATLRNGDEVRHLLIYPVDGARETKLVQLSDSVETLIATGPQYEMRQRADALAQLWITSDGFKSQDGPVFESLERTVALATRMGFTIVWDSRFTKLDRPPLNPTGAVPLATWPGMTPKNGGAYLYALDQMRLLARPTLPRGHKLGVAPSDPKEFVAFMKKATELLDTVGPSVEFLLGGDE